MKKIEGTSITYLIIQIVALIIGAMVIWPIFDIFWCNVISHTEFQYSIGSHVVEPIIFGIIAGIILWGINILAEKRKAKK